MTGLTNDIEILVETWGCPCELTFDNYIPHYVSPQKRPGVTKGRKSGGFIVLIKKYLKSNFKIVKSSNNFVWIEVDKLCVNNLSENYNESIFDELYSDINNFWNGNKPILFTGDFNGRTSDVDDILRIDGDIDRELMLIPNTFVDLPKRNNCDKVLNSHGGKNMSHI